MRFNTEKMQPLAEGHEKKVYIHSEDEDKVVALFKDGPASAETPASMKGKYYLTKILHLLAPTSIPDIHLAARNEDQAVLISERKHLDDGHMEHNRLMTLGSNNKLDYDGRENLFELEANRNWLLSYKEKVGDFKELLTYLGVQTDWGSVNFGDDQDGHIIYVDNSFRPWRYSTNESLYGDDSVSKFYDPDKIRELAQDLSENDREKALAYLARQEELYAEEN